MDVGYYAPAARTTLDRVFFCACLSARLAQSPSTSPSTPSLGIGGCVSPPGCGYPRNPAIFGAVRGEVRRWLDLQASGAVFILCNGEREDEGRQGVTHATCRGTGAPTPTVWRRTAAASVVRRHCDTSEPAQQRTAEAPLGAATPTSTQGFLSSNGHASSAAVWRRLKDFSQHGAWCRRPSRRKLAESPCRLRRHPRCLVLLQTGPCR